MQARNDNTFLVLFNEARERNSEALQAKRVRTSSSLRDSSATPQNDTIDKRGLSLRGREMPVAIPLLSFRIILNAMKNPPLRFAPLPFLRKRKN